MSSSSSFALVPSSAQQTPTHYSTETQTPMNTNVKTGYTKVSYVDPSLTPLLIRSSGAAVMASASTLFATQGEPPLSQLFKTGVNGVVTFATTLVAQLPFRQKLFQDESIISEKEYKEITSRGKNKTEEICSKMACTSLNLYPKRVEYYTDLDGKMTSTPAIVSSHTHDQSHNVVASKNGSTKVGTGTKARRIGTPLEQKVQSPPPMQSPPPVQLSKILTVTGKEELNSTAHQSTEPTSSIKRDDDYELMKYS